MSWEGCAQSRQETRPGVPQAGGESGMPARPLSGDGDGDSEKAKVLSNAGRLPYVLLI